MRFAILGSGTGTNAAALLQVWQDGNLGAAEPVAIFCDRRDAPILELGSRFGIPALYLDPGPFKTKLTPEVESAYVEAIRESGADLVVLAGFMRVIKTPFLEAFPRRIINLHPSLLPSFKGLNAIQQAHAYGVRFTGCTVHYVTGDLDGGPIIDQALVEIQPGESLESLSKKVHAAEHRLLPEVVKRLSESLP